ncbi:MAG: hypothetical protein PVJ67_04875 [Candidatus Pacearchaeota archaeon]|jgi:hypothetical protein
MSKKNKTAPGLDDLLGLRETNPLLERVIIGQLIIEYTLVQTIQTKLNNPQSIDLFDISFPKKVELAISLGLIKKDFGVFLNKMNTLRNRFAHNLNYNITRNEIYGLIKEAGSLGVEFTDDVNTNKTVFNELYSDNKDAVSILFDNVAMELGYILNNNGGEFPFM